MPAGCFGWALRITVPAHANIQYLFVMWNHVEACKCGVANQCDLYAQMVHAHPEIRQASHRWRHKVKALAAAAAPYCNC